ncbi:MAG TPA: carbamoyl phosphate synthase small subunit [Firmicutes bacterium]|nr:carbamoyl phosphate synthase small subunit [Bacillota bacterium]
MYWRENRKPAYLLLADGSIYEGVSIGKEGTTVGEAVFATAMVGYQELLTDPSYFGQIVIQTFPLIGNYGVNSTDPESDRCYLNGYIVREWCEIPSNFRCEGNVDEYLKAQNVVGIADVDTRSLTRKIREVGVMNAVITTENVYEKKEELLEKIRDYSIKQAIESTSCKQMQKFSCEHPKYHVALFDFGYKHNIRRELLQRGCNVTVVPCKTTAQEIASLGVDGIMLSNGPGDPADNPEIITNLKEVAKLGIPIFGICMGHQLFALANGAKTVKLKYGHRGANQPVKDLKHDRTYITSQNHGYAVVSDSIDPQVGELSHVNVNDNTCEGVRYKAFPAFTVQFHPEAAAGPHDTAYLFEEFLGMMNERKAK